MHMASKMYFIFLFWGFYLLSLQVYVKQAKMNRWFHSRKKKKTKLRNTSSFDFLHIIVIYKLI